ncbi:Gfo/Idh/MocA family protein [Pseudaestuariivita atlantica]|uniref:Oxidoreductase n=1 Tax=Pseudaestuariivita atlantica TaxID=1317121 RepID=A0A0L1JL16_9RHOB|nr:Gfo/Idh/MocA family oxidoreductase [Pseudaestuariivita atlantica]KNG92436.1 oxidoreductase [Pseudaestuariivita atlantica]
MATIGIGVIGGGYMGKAHSAAFAAVGTVFETTLKPRLAAICGASEASGARYAQAYGFDRAGANWQDVVEDPKVGAVVIASPQDTHLEIAQAAFTLGKPVMCEKPMGLDVAEAEAMCAAADAAGVPHMVAYNYIRTPAAQFVRKLLADGALGQITSFRVEHTEDFFADATVSSWRAHGAANGCLGDLAPHPINAALALMGPVAEVNAVIETVHPTRGGESVTNDDQVTMMMRFDSGVLGHLFASRVATGRKMGYVYEIFGTRGAVRFDQEDQNSVHLYLAEGPEAQRGFTRVLTGPEHPDYLPFCQGPGHGTGYQDQIIIEAKDFLTAIDTGQPVWPTFHDGLAVHRVMAAARASDASRGWQAV